MGFNDCVVTFYETLSVSPVATPTLIFLSCTQNATSNSHFETFVLNLELSKAFMLKLLNDRMQVPAS